MANNYIWLVCIKSSNWTKSISNNINTINRVFSSGGVKTELRYSKIENVYDRYNSYLKALTWDINNTYSQDKEAGVEWLLQKMIGAYRETELVGLGSIRTYYDLEKKQMTADLASIVDYRFRRKGIADRLLREMLIYCKDLNVEIVKVNILKDNKPSLLQIEKNNFEYVEINDDIVTYQKKLINN